LYQPLGEAVRNAQNQVSGWRSITIDIPQVHEKTMNVSVDRSVGGQPATCVGAFSSYRGRVRVSRRNHRSPGLPRGRDARLDRLVDGSPQSNRRPCKSEKAIRRDGFPAGWSLIAKLASKQATPGRLAVKKAANTRHCNSEKEP
jgi:hypothetical protein